MPEVKVYSYEPPKGKTKAEIPEEVESPVNEVAEDHVEPDDEEDLPKPVEKHRVYSKPKAKPVPAHNKKSKQ
jgi:hypothetical protein